MSTEESLKASLRKRGSIEARLTSFDAFLQNVQDQANQQLPDETILELNSRLEKVTNMQPEFEALQETIEGLVKEEDLTKQYTERCGMEERFSKSTAKAQQILGIHLTTTQQNAQETSVSTNNNNVQPSNRLKLPTIKLPPFSGNYNDWLEFREMFESLIHNRDDLKNIEKFQYLRLSLEGDAAQVIKSIEFTNDNYRNAWTVLQERYDNKRILVNNHVTALFNIEPIPKESSSKIRQLIDTVSKHLRALQALNQPTAQWDTLIVHMVATKLDPFTIRKWEEHKDKDVPTYEDLKKFLKGRADLLESIEHSRSSNKPSINKVKDKPSGSKSLVGLSVQPSTCSVCKGEHPIYNCSELLNLSAKQRKERIMGLRLCINCLKSGHMASSCKGGTCRKCTQKHNTLLHQDDRPEGNQNSRERTDPPIAESSTSNHATSPGVYILLSTAKIKLPARDGKIVTCRALLDSGSQSNFISEELCATLNLPKTKIRHSVSGIGQAITSINFKVTLTIKSCISDFTTTLNCLVIPQISGYTPGIPLDLSNVAIPSNLTLADPDFHTPSKVQLLIGAGIFWDILEPGNVKLGHKQPVLQNTKLGWVVAGSLSSINSIQDFGHMSTSHHCQELHDQLQLFWQIEDCDIKNSKHSTEENDCEDHFLKTTTRAPDGRFIVEIPLKASPDVLGESKQTTTQRFLQMERKLQNNPALKEEYSSFLHEYERLGHMTPVTTQVKGAYFIPHHPVINLEKTTTKVRVVFDASSKTTTGVSLNEIQMVGPRTQDDLIDIVLRFRRHKIALTADVEKMYRQVLIAEPQRPLQTILWRENMSKEMQTFQLNTVTYGMAAASFLAIRALQQTAYDNETQYPKAASTILSDFYVDDLLTGADSTDEAIKLRNEIIEILHTGQFTLKKWTSNQAEALEQTPHSSTIDVLSIGEDGRTKTLGLLWDPNGDNFEFKLNLDPNHTTSTKRAVLSCIAKIFDPMGLLSPVVLLAKLIIQKLWEIRSDWDDPLPDAISARWEQFRDQLTLLNNVSIPRQVFCADFIRVELHGFSDASKRAYGGCVYARSVSPDGSITVRLICSKAKVAPLKALTIPRLELSGALILAMLITKVKKLFKEHISSVHCWSDSTIALGWIHTSPHLLETFVSNRVSKIQSMTQPDEWRHVSSEDNPADILSRGMMPRDIIHAESWFYGPEWLSRDITDATEINPSLDMLPELRRPLEIALHALDDHILEIFLAFSKLWKLQRSMAYVLRFLTPKPRRNSGPITTEELYNALLKLVKLSQLQAFPEEYEALSRSKPISGKSRLLSLDPFIHDDGTIRVGGRLDRSNYSFDKKHPMVLHNKHPLAKLIFAAEHLRLLHAGPQLLLSSVRERFWPLFGRGLARKTVHKCNICFRSKPRFVHPIMGQLPRHRIVQSAPFQATGVDYAGPFSIKDRSGRGCKVSKCYLALFVCLATKCVHLELASALSTECFLMAFRRFISRRGRPSHLYSDNGTNFVGANSDLQELGQFLKDHADELTEKLANEFIQWHFIPAGSPHFGGLWEAGIRSAKHHLKRVMGTGSYTFEELNTIFVQIEAILNSRPLSPLSTDPNDPNPLTPSHFLVANTLTSLPEPALLDIPENRLSIYERLQQVKQSFWKRWSTDYISELQGRTKWKVDHEGPVVGMLALIKDQNAPPQRWLLGRIQELYPGKDGVTRVVLLRTVKGTLLKRAVQNICPLPVQ